MFYIWYDAALPQPDLDYQRAYCAEQVASMVNAAIRRNETVILDFGSNEDNYKTVNYITELDLPLYFNFHNSSEFMIKSITERLQSSKREHI